MFFIKLLIVIGGFVFLGFIFVRRLLLLLTQNKMQAKLEEEEARHRQQDTDDKTQTSLAVETSDTTKIAPVKIAKGDDLRKIFKKGEVLFSRKDFSAAEQAFISIISIDETHLDANLHLGLVYLETANHPKAEFFFHKLVNLKKDPIYYGNLGLALYKQGRLLEAAEAYENALSMDDSRAARFANLAHVYRELNNDEKALHNFEKASRKSPRNKDYLWATIEYYKKLGLTEELHSAAKRLLELDPYNQEAKNLME